MREHPTGRDNLPKSPPKAVHIKKWRHGQMDIGSGILGGSIVLGAVATAFKLFGKNGNGNGSEKSKLCMEHSGIATAVKDMREDIKDIKKNVGILIERRISPRD